MSSHINFDENESEDNFRVIEPSFSDDGGSFDLNTEDSSSYAALNVALEAVLDRHTASNKA